MDEREKKLEEILNSSARVVHLNVGGKKCKLLST
jgi:hypothetical protein